MQNEVERQWEIIGRNVKKHRRRQRLSLRALAARCGASASFLSQLERGASGAHISTLMQIGAALHASLSELTMEADEAEVHFIPARERKAIADEHDHKKVLISRKAYGSFEIFVHMIAPSTSNADEPYTHGNAHECLFVLGGEIEAQVGNQVFNLLTGDALEYRSNLPHLVTNRSRKTAEVMFIVGPDEPDFPAED